MHAKHQQGKGLFSFMAGSIAALIAIAGVLITLNHNKERDFKNPATSKQQPASQDDQTEVLLPSNVPASTANNTRTIAPTREDDEPIVASTPRTRPAKPRTEPEITADEEEPVVSKEKPKKPETVRRVPDMMDDPVLGDITENEPPRETKPRKPADSKADNRQPEKPKLSEAEKRRRQQEDIADRNAKPTAEQILNSGSIEKAREVARQEAQAKRAQQRAAEAANAKSAASKSDNAPAKESQADQPAAPSKANSEAKPRAESKLANTSRTTVQAGAYNTRQAAEAQRAKLALMGVNTQVVEVQSNGKTLYRVQTRSMDSQRANQVRETLQQNGVNSIPRKQ